MPVDTAAEDDALVAAKPEFHRFYAHWYPRMVRLGFLMSGSFHAAEEVVQEAFISAYRDWDRVREFDRPDAWVRRVVVNKAHSRLRRAYAETRARVRWAGGHRFEVELPETTDAFWREVRALPRRQAQTVVLRHSEGYSTGEIAELLGLSASTVRVHLYRARATLAERLGLEIT